MGYRQCAISALPTSKLDDEVTDRFPDGTVQQVVVLQHGDDPEIEPGALIVRLILTAVAGPDGGEQSSTHSSRHTAKRSASCAKT